MSHFPSYLSRACGEGEKTIREYIIKLHACMGVKPPMLEPMYVCPQVHVHKCGHKLAPDDEGRAFPLVLVLCYGRYDWWMYSQERNSLNGAISQGSDDNLSLKQQLKGISLKLAHF